MIQLKPEPGDETKYGIHTVASSRIVPDATKSQGVKEPEPLNSQ